MTCYVQGNDINITKGDKFNFIIASTDGVSASDKCELYVGQNEMDVIQSPVKSLETPIILEDKQFRFNLKTDSESNVNISTSENGVKVETSWIGIV